MTDLNQVLDLFQRLDIGRMHCDAGNLELASKMFESVLDLDPRNTMALNNLATLHFKAKPKQLAAAKFRLSQVFAIDPDNAVALCSTAQIAQEERNWPMADANFRRAIEVDPTNPTLFINYGYFSQLMGDYRKAVENYTNARDLNPLDFNARHWRSMSMMTVADSQSEWDEALSEYEIRHVLVPSQRNFGKPMYTGAEDLRGKNMLLVTEQGVGDAVMFGRYARYFNSIGARCYILCREDQIKLMQRLNGISKAQSDVSKLPPFDYWLPLMSAMKVTGYPTITVGNSPYLYWPYQVNYKDFNGPRPRIGLCWKGNPQHGNDRFRSMSGYTFCEIFRDMTADADFFSLLQPKDNTDKPDFVSDINISGLVDLADTIASMDLVVSVDTAQVHIAGAMGVNVFMAMANCVDWRWGVNGQRGKEWYPTLTIFKSDRPLEWTETLSRIKHGVAEFIQGYKDSYKSATEASA